jgi:hypothetical protein
MAARKKQTAPPDPDQVLHLQVAKGEVVIYDGLAYGDRATLQVPRRDLERVEGSYAEVDPAKVPDVAEL